MRKLTTFLAFVALVAFTAWLTLYVLGPFFEAVADQIVRHMP
jgi:hypothetical protein